MNVMLRVIALMDVMLKVIPVLVGLFSLYLMLLQFKHPDATPMRVFLCGLFNSCEVRQEWTK